MTAIRVKDVIATVSDLLAQMLAAIRGANALTLITGILVLAGALGGGLSGRLYDAVVLKTYGATRRQLIRAFIVEYAVLGLASAVFGIAVGALALLVPGLLDSRNALGRSPGDGASLTALLAMAVAIAAGLARDLAGAHRQAGADLRNE